MSLAAAVPATSPRGWAAAVAAGPIPRPDAVCLCGRPAVNASARHWLCANHPPQPGDWVTASTGPRSPSTRPVTP